MAQDDQDDEGDQGDQQEHTTRPASFTSMTCIRSSNLTTVELSISSPTCTYAWPLVSFSSCVSIKFQKSARTLCFCNSMSCALRCRSESRVLQHASGSCKPVSKGRGVEGTIYVLRSMDDAFEYVKNTVYSTVQVSCKQIASVRINEIRADQSLGYGATSFPTVRRPYMCQFCVSGSVQRIELHVIQLCICDVCRVRLLSKG